mgnify:CR=1 FL=1
MAVGMAEDDDAISVERHAGAGVAWGEASKDAQIRGMLQEVVEDVNHQGEEHGRHRIALMEAFCVGDEVAVPSIDKDARGGRGKQYGHPFAPTTSKAKVLQHLEEKGPGHGVEGAGNV